MKDFTEYKDLIKNEVANFKNQVNPTLNNSARKGHERINEFLEILPKVEKHMDEFCKNYFEGKTLTNEEVSKLKFINTEIYQDFINYCKIPVLSKNNE